jgi:hypothetical protein
MKNGLDLVISLKYKIACACIFNAVGQQMHYMDVELEKGQNSVPVNGIENWSEGIYFIRVEAGGQVYTEKIVKKN